MSRVKSGVPIGGMGLEGKFVALGEGRPSNH